jgi:hypothetical protein
MRALRRHHLDRIKAKAKRIMRLWSTPSLTLESIEAIGKNAAMHCTHVCVMCRFDKLYPPPRDKKVRDE